APAKKKAGLSWKEKRELEGMVEAIEVAEAKLEELDAVLADPATYAERGDEVPALTAERDAAAAAVEQLMERWEALEAKRD
ncbi:MAG TPA: ABC transporter ATP-binding protein, partial [Polyangiaceae bacterium LLY-WYZ-15_(1-7)]|nr:ABC transporter ATP-binding protein [Polyangiaceae bacterium LLY-WYZ-15_(1-7)]